VSSDDVLSFFLSCVARRQNRSGEEGRAGPTAYLLDSKRGYGIARRNCAEPLKTVSGSRRIRGLTGAPSRMPGPISAPAGSEIEVGHRHAGNDFCDLAYCRRCRPDKIPERCRRGSKLRVQRKSARRWTRHRAVEVIGNDGSMSNDAGRSTSSTMRRYPRGRLLPRWGRQYLKQRGAVHDLRRLVGDSAARLFAPRMVLGL